MPRIAIPTTIPRILRPVLYPDYHAPTLAACFFRGGAGRFAHDGISQMLPSRYAPGMRPSLSHFWTTRGWASTRLAKVETIWKGRGYEAAGMIFLEDGGIIGEFTANAPADVVCELGILNSMRRSSLSRDARMAQARFLQIGDRDPTRYF
jgi:hypothetical protein